jgi:hypothetical protein
MFLALGIITSALATCVAEAAAPEMAQMACCKAGHKSCGSHGTPADCCKTSPHSDWQFTTVGKISAPQPATIWLALGPAALVPDLGLRPVVFVEDSAPPGTKHPTYLLLSTLRL